VGLIGVVHNVAVAGMKRQPKAWGIDPKYEQTTVAGKVMEVLWDVERGYPGAGASLIEEFSPASCSSPAGIVGLCREDAFEAVGKAFSQARNQGVAAEEPRHWALRPLKRPSGLRDDKNIRIMGRLMLPTNFLFDSIVLGLEIILCKSMVDALVNLKVSYFSQCSQLACHTGAESSAVCYPEILANGIVHQSIALSTTDSLTRYIHFSPILCISTASWNR